jgi:hypothetical protein
MKKNSIISGLLLVLSISFISSCERVKELPPYHAKGKIISITTACYGEAVLIDVENPQGIGLAGTFFDISYQNGIRVPYFSKVGLPDSIPQTIGTSLYFKYREISNDEWENNNPFLPSEPVICLLPVGPPPSKIYIITEIISFE